MGHCERGSWSNSWGLQLLERIVDPDWRRSSRWTQRWAGRFERLMHRGRALIEVPGEQTDLAAERDAEVFAFERELVERAPFIRQERCIIRHHVDHCLEPVPGRIIARPGLPKWIGAAPGGRQHGEP